MKNKIKTMMKMQNTPVITATHLVKEKILQTMEPFANQEGNQKVSDNKCY